MNDDHEHKHTCKFCQKSFPCGRSLGGHMRSHLINISSSDHHKHADNQKLPRKKLPPIIVKTDFSTQFGYGCIDENQNKPLKSSEEEEEEEDTLLRRKLKECGKNFQSRKALFGLIKSSSVNGKSTHTTAEDDSCDSQSDNEATTLPKKKRSRNRTKRYKVTKNSSSSLTVVNFSPSVSDSIDQQEQEEVALSLIILSGDKADRVGIISPAIESSHNSSDFLEVEKIALTSKFKKLRNGKLGPTKNVLNTRKLGDEEENLDYVQFNEPEVKSPKNSMIKGQFGTIRKKNNKPRKRNKPTETISQDFEKTSKFKCSVCEKAFQSYQALGGHRASHKKFNGCCAPRNENSLEVESSHSKNDYYKELMINSSASKALFGCIKTSKEHECPICFKVFASGQALGGHKRSHLVADHQVKSNASLVNDHKLVRENRDFLDLNLPAPADDDQEECNDSEQWWFD